MKCRINMWVKEDCELNNKSINKYWMKNGHEEVVDALMTNKT